LQTRREDARWSTAGHCLDNPQHSGHLGAPRLHPWLALRGAGLRCTVGEARSSSRRFAVGHIPQLSDKQARSLRSVVLREIHEDTAAIRYGPYYPCVITPSCHHRAHVGHCITAHPGLPTIALTCVQDRH